MTTYIKKVPDDRDGQCKSSNYGFCCFYGHPKCEDYNEICARERILFKKAKPPVIKSIKELPRPRRKRC